VGCCNAAAGNGELLVSADEEQWTEVFFGRFLDVGGCGMRKPRLVVLAVVAALLVALPGSARASAPPAGGDAKAIAAQASCASLKKKARRYRRGSANRRRYVRRYKKCRARANRERSESRAPDGTPSGPEATPAPVAAPAPPAPPSTTLAGPIYLPSIFPNPNGYVRGAGCQPGYEQTYILAGYSCQYGGYNSYLLLPSGPVWTPVYLLFGIWYCADGGFRFRC
jgi:hypothetical protein